MIKKLFSHSIIYGLTGTVSTLASIFLIPIYTRILTPSDYGVIAIIVTSTTILAVISKLGLSSSIFWAYFRAKTIEDKRKVVGTAFLFQLIFGTFLVILLLLFSDRINELLFPESQPSIYLKIGILTTFFLAGNALPLAVFRAQEKPFRYIFISLGTFLINIILAILLVVIFRVGVIGVFLATLLSNVAVYLIATPLILMNAEITISRRWLGEMLSFGLPMVPAGLAMWVLNSSDRYFLNYFRDLSEVGIYNVGYRVGMLIVLVVGAIQLAYVPFMFSIAKKSYAKNVYSRFTSYYFVILFFVGLTLSIFSKEAIQVLTGERFHSAFTVVPFIAFSYVAYGMYNNFATGVSLKKKTVYSAVSVIVASIVNIILNFIIIPEFGAQGAAATTLISFILLMVIIYLFSNSLYPIPYQFSRMLKVLLVGTVVLLIGWNLNFFVWLNIFLKSIIIILFFVVLYLINFFTKEEKKKISNTLENFKDSKNKVEMVLGFLAKGK